MQRSDKPVNAARRASDLRRTSYGDVTAARRIGVNNPELSS
jgi:hypothetical protein